MTALPKVLVVSSGWPNEENPLSATFVRDQTRAVAADFDMAVLVIRVAGWREIVRRPRLPGVRAVGGDAFPVFEATAWHPPLSPRWQARLLLRPGEGASDDPALSNRVLDLLLDRYLAAARRGLRAVVRQWGRPALIHGHFVLPGGWAGHRLAWDMGVPAVLTEHSSRLEDQIATPLRRRLVTETLGAVHTTIAVSPFQADQIRTVVPSTPVEVVGNLIPTDFFTPPEGDPATSDRRPYRFFSLAHLIPRKGFDTLLRAAAELSSRPSGDFVLHIGGDGPDRQDLEAQADALGLSGRVHFLGRMMPEEARDAMRWCNAFVLASRRESFGVVLGEAMACGRPVLATRCGGAEFVVTETTGMLVDVDDAPALADAMDDLVSGRRLFDSGAIRAQVIDRFGLRAFRSGLGRAYRNALGGDSARRVSA